MILSLTQVSMFTLTANSKQQCVVLCMIPTLARYGFPRDRSAQQLGIQACQLPRGHRHHPICLYGTGDGVNCDASCDASIPRYRNPYLWPNALACNVAAEMPLRKRVRFAEGTNFEMKVTNRQSCTAGSLAEGTLPCPNTSLTCQETCFGLVHLDMALPRNRRRPQGAVTPLSLQHMYVTCAVNEVSIIQHHGMLHVLHTPGCLCNELTFYLRVSHLMVHHHCVASKVSKTYACSGDSRIDR